MKRKGKKILVFIGCIMSFAISFGFISNLLGMDLFDKDDEEKDAYVLHAGAAANVEEGTITVDGIIDDGYVCLTSDPVHKVMASEQLISVSGSAALSSNQDELSKTSDIQYYVAQTDTKIYLVIRDFGTKWGASRSEMLMRNNYYFRIGVNADDYSQAAVLNVAKNASGASLLCFADAENKYTEGYTDFITASAFGKYKLDETTNEETLTFSINDNADYYRYVAYIEIEIDKALLVESFNSVFGTELEEFGGELYLVSILKPYHWTGNTGTDNASFGYPVYGNILTDEELEDIGGKTKLYPYTIVFE